LPQLLFLCAVQRPDGNTWLFREITPHLPARGLSNLNPRLFSAVCISFDSGVLAGTGMVFWIGLPPPMVQTKAGVGNLSNRHHILRFVLE
jgi:hypothetical protein